MGMTARERLLAWWARPSSPYLVSLAAQLLVAPWLAHDWDGFVFLRSAQDLLAGTTPYETAEAAPPHIFLDDHWPVVNTWYAYPPLMLLLFTPLVGLMQLVSSDPLALRLALKLPFIAGTLLLAWAAGRLVERLSENDGAARRRKVEVLLLLNPFLLFVAAAWGMFDAAMMALLLLSTLLLVERRYAWAGAAFGLATLVKVFPLFVAPLFAVHAWRRHGPRATVRFVGVAVAVASAVCLPFFLAAPRGFLNQVLLMHLQRGPQGFALVSFPLQLRNLNNLFGWDIPIAPQGVVVAVAGALLWVTLAVLYLLWRRADDERGLLRLVLAAFLALLLVNKVVNEQYLVMPVAMLATLAALEGSDRLRRALAAFTWGGFVSSVLIGLHFITFLPADVRARWVPVEPEAFVEAVAAATGIPVILVYSIPHAAAILALVPALVWTLRLVGPVLRDAVVGLARAFAREDLGRAGRAGAHALVATLLLLPPLASGVLAIPADVEAAEVRPTDGIVLARYDLTHENPGHDPTVRDGSWARGPYPATWRGFYDTTPQKAWEDLLLLKAAGVDVVVVTYEAGNGIRLETFLDAVQSVGLRAAPSLDLGALRECPDAQRLRPSDVPDEGPTPLDETTADLAAQCVRTALRPFRGHPAAFLWDDAPVLFALNASGLAEGPLPLDAWADVALVAPADGARLVTSIEPGERRTFAWADAAYVQPPQEQDLAAFRDATRARLDADGLGVAAAFPATWRARHADAYAPTWEDALAGGADWVVVPWNVHREGGALEPLLEGDRAWLDATPAYASRLREARA